MRINLIESIADVINSEPIDGLTGEEMEYLIKQLNMHEQMARQIVMSYDYTKLMDLIKERQKLSFPTIFKNV